MLAKLDAVNRILDAVGEDPVDSLSSGLPDAEKAERFLDRVASKVQEIGWHCNTDEEYAFAVDVGGHVIIPSNVLRVDAAGTDKWRDLVVRENPSVTGERLLYDRVDQTYEFDEDSIVCDVVWENTWLGLTPTLQHYISDLAARAYQQSNMGSIALDKFIVQDIMTSYAQLLDSEAENEESNVLTDSASLRWATQRYHPLYGLKG